MITSNMMRKATAIPMPQRLTLAASLAPTLLLSMAIYKRLSNPRTACNKINISNVSKLSSVSKSAIFSSQMIRTHYIGTHEFENAKTQHIAALYGPAHNCIIWDSNIVPKYRVSSPKLWLVSVRLYCLHLHHRRSPNIDTALSIPTLSKASGHHLPAANPRAHKAG